MSAAGAGAVAERRLTSEMVDPSLTSMPAVRTVGTEASEMRASAMACAFPWSRAGIASGRALGGWCVSTV